MAGKKRQKADILPFDEVMEMEYLERVKYLRKHQNEMAAAYSTEEMNAFLASLFEFIYGDEPSALDVKDMESTRRSMWMGNHAAITRAIHEMITEGGRMPTVTEISQKTKLSRVTVTKHLKHFEKDEYLHFHRQKWKLATERVLLKLSQYVFSQYVDYPESIRAASVYLKFADKFLHPVASAPAEASTATTNNFIQVNHIYINQETIKALPEDRRQLIENIILEANTATPARNGGVD